jgi:hypothetical protein
MSRENYYCVPERELCIRDQLDSALAFSPPKLQHSVERAVENAVGVVTETTRLD